MLVHLAALCFTTGFQLAYARHNTTVSNNDAAITYSGNWIKTSDNLTTEGSYILTRDPSAKAFFNFTGTAIYFMSPLWPYLSSTAISLDSSSSVVIDLVDHNHPGVGYGFATVNSTTIWGISGLPNTRHTLVISVGEGQPLAVVDSLIYTELQAIPEHLLFIIVGAALGSLGFLVLLMVPWLLVRQRRHVKVKAKHTDYARYSLERAGYQISTPVYRIAQHMIPRVPVSNIHSDAHSKQDSKDRPLSSDSIAKSLPPGACNPLQQIISDVNHAVEVDTFPGRESDPFRRASPNGSCLTTATSPPISPPGSPRTRFLPASESAVKRPFQQLNISSTVDEAFTPPIPESQIPLPSSRSLISMHESVTPSATAEGVLDLVSSFPTVPHSELPTASPVYEREYVLPFPEAQSTIEVEPRNPTPPPPPPDTLPFYNPVLNVARPSKLENLLRDYDFVFLLDDSGSMGGSLWVEARETLNGITNYILDHGWDKDRIDLRFLNSDHLFHFKELNGLQDRDKIRDVVNRVIPASGTPTGRRTFELLNAHIDRLECAKGTESYSKIKPFVLIIVTDGAPNDSPEFELSKVLVTAANRLSNAHHHPNSVGVQFIQIGNNPIAEHALKTLVKIDTKGMVDTVSYSELGSLSAEKLERILLGGLHPNIRAQKPRYF